MLGGAGPTTNLGDQPIVVAKAIANRVTSRNFQRSTNRSCDRAAARFVPFAGSRERR